MGCYLLEPGSSCHRSRGTPQSLPLPLFCLPCPLHSFPFCACPWRPGGGGRGLGWRGIGRSGLGLVHASLAYRRLPSALSLFCFCFGTVVGFGGSPKLNKNNGTKLIIGPRAPSPLCACRRERACVPAGPRVDGVPVPCEALMWAVACRVREDEGVGLV